MTDWNDPELKPLRDDFIASFQRRREVLAEIVRGSGTDFDLRVAVHNLAGSAATYGFVEMGRFSCALDDFISLNNGAKTGRLSAFVQELIRLLEAAEKTGSDVRADAAVLQEITSCVESLAAATRP
jgi:hypothetical protein